MRQWDPQWAAYRRAPPRRPLRPARLRACRGHRDPVLEPGRPGRGDGCRGARAGGARRLLAGGADRPRHRARVPHPRVRPGLGLRRAQRPARPRARPRSEAAFERGEALEEAKDWAAVGRVRRRASGSTDSASPPAGLRPRRATPSGRWPTRRTCRRSRTATRSCSTRPRSGGWASCACRCSRSSGGLDESSTCGRRGPASSPRSRARGGSTSRTSPTCPASSGPSGSPRRCWSSWRPSTGP